MRSKTITIPGKPQGKGRPRFMKYGHAYTTEQTRRYEELIRACWMEQADGWKCREGAVCIVVEACFSIQKSARKERKIAMFSGQIKPIVKPDVDCILKAVLDSLNGYAWLDNKQIVSATISKHYSENPCVKVVLYDV